MKKHLPTIIVVVIFLCGLSLFVYPTISNLYNQHLNNTLIGDYKDTFADTTPGELNKALQDAKKVMLAEVYRILVLGFGEPPTKFTWAPKGADGNYQSEPKEYTPQSFYAEMLGEDLQNDYVMLMNDPTREYWKKDTRYTLMGGETCAVSSYCECPVTMKDMEDFHWTYHRRRQGAHPIRLAKGAAHCEERP